MPRYYHFSRTLLLTIMAAWLILSACEIEGGVQRATPTVLPATRIPPTSAAVVQQVAARADTWLIGLIDPPGDLYPYPANASARRSAAPLTELLYPSPILALNYGYTTTGVLERIPSLENGDAEIRKSEVYLDAIGIITTTATSTITTVDQLVVTFHWNRQLRWSDGVPVTAADSVFAYEMARKSPPGDEARDLLAETDRYELVDEYTTRAILKPDIVGSTYFMSYWTPLPRHVLKDIPPDKVRESEFARAPLGYGPYAIEQRTPSEIRMLRNQYYFGPPPFASRLTFSIATMEFLRSSVLNGNLDALITDRVSSELFAPIESDRSAGAQVFYMPGPIWEHIDFNLDVPTLQEIRVRHAIAFGTNRAAMVRDLLGGRAPVLDSWVLPNQPGIAPQSQISRYPYDPDQARKLLEEAGYTVIGTDGIRASTTGMTLTLQLMTTEASLLRQEIARMFQQDMRAIGIQVDLNPLPSDELFAPDGPLFQRQFELALFGWIAGPDPGGLPLWSCAAVPSEGNRWAGNNFAGWCFRDADRAIKDASTSLDPDRRQAAYALQQQLWTRELPSVPLFQRLSLTVAAPDVRGIKPDPLAPITWNIRDWKRAK